jgi:chromosome segregation ATPase
MNARTLALLTGCLFTTAPLFAEGPPQASPGELRMREQLKATMLQLRNAETERAALQAAQTERDQKIKKLEEQVAALTKQATDDKEAADKAAAKLAEEIAVKSADIARLNDLLVKSEDTGKKSAALLKKTEEQRAKLAAEAIQLQRTVTDQRAKNAKMYEAAEEVLSRYEKFSLGTAITAREPFAGITRARLQSYVDESDAKLSAGRIRVDGTTPKPPPAKAKEAPKR